METPKLHYGNFFFCTSEVLMPQRPLMRQVRSNLANALLRFAFENEKLLQNSDRNILDAIRDELSTADEIDLSVKLNRKDGKVVLKCNDLQYKFTDPSVKDPSPPKS